MPEPNKLLCKSVFSSVKYKWMKTASGDWKDSDWTKCGTHPSLSLMFSSIDRPHQLYIGLVFNTGVCLCICGSEM